MSRAGRAQVRGRREALAPLNGRSPGGGYRRNGDPGWLPELAGGTPGAVHAENARRREGRQARISQFGQLLGDGMTVLEAGAAMGIAETTAREYAREIRSRDGAP